MSGVSYLQAYVRCPYYLRDDGKTKLHCEGFVDDSKIELVFPNKQARRQYINDHCCGDFAQCMVCKAISEAKYCDDAEME